MNEGSSHRSGFASGGVLNDGVLDSSDLPHSAQTHFRLCWHGVVLQVARCAMEALGSPEGVLRQAPFLGEYLAQIGQRGVVWTDAVAVRTWWEAIEKWEAGATGHLPLRAVRLGLGGDWHLIGAWLTAGLPEDDPRLGPLFARLQGGTMTQPTVGFLNACWNNRGAGPVRRLQDWGLVQIHPGPDSRHTWGVQVATWAWDALQGGGPEGASRPAGSGWVFESVPQSAPVASALVLPDETRRALESLPGLVLKGALDCVVVRGPRASGRTSLLRELAAKLGRGLLTFSPALKSDDERWAQVGPLAAVLGVLPVAEFDLATGETLRVPALPDLSGPLLVTLGRCGGLAGPGAQRAVIIGLVVPSPGERRTLWERIMPAAETDLHEDLVTRYRMPAGRLVSLGHQALARAALAARSTLGVDDFVASARVMHAEAIGSLASALSAGGSWGDLALPPDVIGELRAVESRCRHREQLAAVDHRFARNAGVRVLFTGPSGTSKTLAVRAIAAELGRDVYRLDLAAVVNKYLGETEKNLERVLTLAEELDVVLLIDEGDALLARRTSVQTSNDRYANLETNFLLQRLESFEGIVFITTNAGERVDPAFHRRLDAVVEFRAPEVAERRRLWELHLPGASSVDPRLLDQIAGQCALTGGQVRNAALHARLLARVKVFWTSLVRPPRQPLIE